MPLASIRFFSFPLGRRHDLIKKKNIDCITQWSIIFIYLLFTAFGCHCHIMQSLWIQQSRSPPLTHFHDGRRRIRHRCRCCLVIIGVCYYVLSFDTHSFFFFRFLWCAIKACLLENLCRSHSDNRSTRVQAAAHASASDTYKRKKNETYGSVVDARFKINLNIDGEWDHGDKIGLTRMYNKCNLKLKWMYFPCACRVRCRHQLIIIITFQSFSTFHFLLFFQFIYSAINLGGTHFNSIMISIGNY